MNKRGQFDISFSMIFSIIIIISTIAIGAYVINYFLGLQACTQMAQFYTGFEDTVNNAYNAPIVGQDYNVSVPGDVTDVCFGTLNETVSPDSTAEHNNLAIYTPAKTANLFIYPVSSSCDQAQPFITLAHVNVAEFFCVQTENGQVGVRLDKNSDEADVTITP